MTFLDPQLQRHFERVCTLVQCYSPDQVPVCALLDAWFWFHLTEGDGSPRADEAIELLLSSELRPALRSWYQHHGAYINPAAIEFRDHLSRLAGE